MTTPNLLNKMTIQQAACILMFLLVSLCNQIHGQIIIDAKDMPMPNDTFIISTTTQDTIDPTLTGPDYFWDYAHLKHEQQIEKTILHVDSINLDGLQQFVFPTAKIATEDPYADFSISPIGFIFSNKLMLYDINAKSMEILGYRADVQGLQLPIGYRGKDILYQFPLQYGDTYSSNSQYGIPIPQFGHYGQKIKRNNVVDGWGTLVTPLDTFDVLRIHSTYIVTDTIYSDSLQTPYLVPSTFLNEYKWLAKGENTPVLTVYSVDFFGLNASYRAEYKDTLRPKQPLNNGISTESIIQIFPNPIAHSSTISFNVKSLIFNLSIEIIGIDGTYHRLYESKTLEAGIHEFEFNSRGFETGVYLIRFKAHNFEILKKVVIIKTG